MSDWNRLMQQEHHSDGVSLSSSSMLMNTFDRQQQKQQQQEDKNGISNTSIMNELTTTAANHRNNKRSSSGIDTILSLEHGGTRKRQATEAAPAGIQDVNTSVSLSTSLSSAFLWYNGLHDCNTTSSVSTGEEGGAFLTQHRKQAQQQPQYPQQSYNPVAALNNEWFVPMHLMDSITSSSGCGNKTEKEDRSVTYNSIPNTNTFQYNNNRVLYGGDPTTINSNSYKTLVGGILVDGENNTALHLAIQNGAINQALEMIRCGGVSIDHTNMKGVTALATASQKGYLSVVRKLLEAGANPQLSNRLGQTPLIQACHNGHLDTVKCLVEHGAVVEHANYNRTTALMRAAQQGHKHCVLFLLKSHANVNRKNGEQMTPLMLAAQRGHAEVAHVLISAGADIDGKSAQGSTSLMLACKRGNYQVVQVLVALGAELYIKDMKERTARDIVRRKGNAALMRLLCPTLQVAYMKHQARRDVNYSILKYRKLLQHERATVNLSNNTQSTPAPQILHSITSSALIKSTLPPWRQALVNIMTLPAPIAVHIVTYIPNPDLWHTRLDILAARSHLEPDPATLCAFDLIDEVLTDAGFLTGVGKAGIPAPLPFSTWSEWEEWGIKSDTSPDLHQPTSFFDNSYHMFLSDDDSEAASSVDAVVAPPARLNPPGHLSSDLDDVFYDFNIVIPHRRRRRSHIFFTPTEYPPLANIAAKPFILELRRKANFLSLFNTNATSTYTSQHPFNPLFSSSTSNASATTAQQHHNLISILTSPPYNMPMSLFDQLKQSAEIEAVIRRLSKFVHFDSVKALKIVELATELVHWYEQRRDKL